MTQPEWVGEIVRTGANYLICVTEDDKMFKTWTQDVSYDDPLIALPTKINSFSKFLKKFR